MLKNIHDLGLDCIVCIGGNGTQKTAAKLAQAGVNVVSVPKTIDNDVWGTDVSFGFDSAVTIATDAIDRLHSTASSHQRVMVIEVMGHKAGWIALYSGMAGGGDVILIPELSYDIHNIGNTIIERLKRIYTKTLMLKQQESEPETDGNNAPDDFIQQIIHVIEANLANENFNVKMLAEQLNMSQPTLYRKIKQRSELAAIDMIRSVRMSKAASLIMENRYSIQEIAEMVGYSDTRTLRKHFTEQFGVSPSKYMEKD